MFLMIKAFCNQNLMKPISENFSLNVLNNNSLADYFTKPVFPNFNIAMIFGRYLIGTNALYQTEYMKIKDMKYKLSYSLEEMLISCSYDMIPCNSTDFEWFYDVMHGKVIIFII
jgi:hypothetical protein